MYQLVVPFTRYLMAAPSIPVEPSLALTLAVTVTGLCAWATGACTRNARTRATVSSAPSRNLALWLFIPFISYFSSHRRLLDQMNR